MKKESYCFKALRYLKDFRLSKNLLFLSKEGYLEEVGWIRSIKEKQRVDKEGRPVPWLNYTCIDFLDFFLRKEMVVFEYGSGSSTVYFARRAGRVFSVEHSREWYNRLRANKPDNVSLLFRELDEGKEYCRAIQSTNELFDLVLVDGRDRVNCIRQAVDKLKEKGIIILDDSDRESYREGILFLLSLGFKQYDFKGMVPASLASSVSSAFFRHHLI